MVAVEVKGTVLLGIRDMAVVHLWFLVCGDTVDGVCPFFEMLVAQNLPQSEVALERKQTITASLMLGPDPSALNNPKSTPIFSEMLLSPPCLN